MNFYLEKYGFCEPQIKEAPSKELGIIVVIPCYDEPDLITSLRALNLCDKTQQDTEVIVVVNSSELAEDSALASNSNTIDEFQKFSTEKISLKFHLIHANNLPKKHAGVGLARKIGMDEAVHRFDQIGVDGIIVCFDADATCDKNYLAEIEKHFNKHTKSPGCSIFYEHPISGQEFSNTIYEGITNYELHLRYYNLCLKMSGLPYAFHTVGSSMAVKSSAYQKQGGMNKRKAGEDFYFIHKIIALGNFTELKTTRVIPSPRVSDRVPFGTGKAIGDYIKSDSGIYMTYNFDIFIEIKSFVEKVKEIYQDEFKTEDFSTPFRNFLSQEDWQSKIAEIKKNTSNYDAFFKRFFAWFDAFKVLKLVHFLRDHGFTNQPIEEASALLLNQVYETPNINNNSEQLELLREIEKK